MDIKLAKSDKQYVEGTDDVYGIMQRVLLRDNKVDQDKEHFWIVGMNHAGLILYVELIVLGSYKSVDVEPMNVFRVAVMKNASRVIAVHNHPSGSLIPSDADKDITDRLIQVARILDIELVDHLIISPESYLSFRAHGLMAELEKSLKYVPTYQVIERIRKEEKAIAREKIQLVEEKVKQEKEKTEAARVLKEKAEAEKRLLINALIEKQVSIENIAKILDITPAMVKRIVSKKK